MCEARYGGAAGNIRATAGRFYAMLHHFLRSTHLRLAVRAPYAFFYTRFIHSPRSGDHRTRLPDAHAHPGTGHSRHSLLSGKDLIATAQTGTGAIGQIKARGRMNGRAVEKANTSATAVGYALFIVAPGLRISTTRSSSST